MTAPRPDQFAAAVEKAVSDIRKIADQIKAEYPWMYGAQHSATVGEKLRSSVGSHDGGPTANVAVSKMSARRHCEEAFTMIEEASNTWKSALGKVTLRDRDPGGTINEPLRYPVSVMQDELREAREAQARRMSRGEGFGEA